MPGQFPTHITLNKSLSVEKMRGRRNFGRTGFKDYFGVITISSSVLYFSKIGQVRTQGNVGVVVS